MYCLILLLLSSIKLRSKKFRLIIDQQKDKQWFTILQNEEKISFHFICVKTLELERIEFLHSKCIFDIYVEDIKRKNLEINWLEEFKAGVSPKNFHIITNPVFASGLLVYYAVDNESFSLKILNENGVIVLTVELLHVSEDSEDWELINEKIPELEEYVFTNFKTLLISTNRRGKLMFNFLDEQNIFIHLYCLFEVYPNGSANKIRIFKINFQIFKPKKSGNETSLETLHQDDTIYEKITISENEIAFQFKKGNVILKAEVKVGHLGLFADFSDIAKKTAYYLNGSKIEQERSCLWNFFLNVKNPNVRSGNIHWINFILRSESDNRHRVFVSLFVPTYSFIKREEIEYCLRFPFLVEWKESDRTALTISLQFGELVVVTDLGAEEKQTLEIEIYKLKLKVKIPFIVREINGWFKIHFFVDDMELLNYEKSNQKKFVGSVWDRINHSIHFKKSFESGVLTDNREFSFKELSAIHRFSEQNFELNLFLRPELNVVQLLTTKYNRLKKNAQKIRNQVKTSNYSTAVVGALLQKKLSLQEIDLGRILSFLKKISFKELFDHYRVLLNIKIDKTQEPNIRKNLIEKQRRINVYFAKLEFEMKRLQELEGFLVKKEIEFWKDDNLEFQRCVADLNTFFNDFEHLMEEMVYGNEDFQKKDR